MVNHTEQGGLKKAIKLRNAVALYASSVLGSGVLILPGLAAILVYIIGSGAGVKLLGRVEKSARKRAVVLPLISLIISLIVVAFVGWLLIVSIAVSLAGIGYAWFHARREAAKRRTGPV